MTVETGASPMLQNHSDVLIIGGGPAGATAAITLAEKGYRVTLLEKARHPRFHIGESLLPANLPLFERLGVAEDIRAIGMQKWGAEFVSPWHAGRTQIFEFADAWDRSMPSAYQVRRSQFDEILIRRADKYGARVIEGCRVRDVEFRGPEKGVRIEAEHEDGRKESFEARFLIDASGRDTFLGNRLNAKQRDRKHNSSAMCRISRIPSAIPTVSAPGNITIFWFEHGWIWYIPLVDGATSVGAVVWPTIT